MAFGPSNHELLAAFEELRISVRSQEAARDAALEELKKSVEAHDALLVDHEATLDYLKDVTLPQMKRDIVLTAAEVFKWSIGKKGKKKVSSYKFSTGKVKALMKIGCVCFGRYGNKPSTADSASYEKIGESLVADRNAIAHCTSIEELDDHVRLCLRGISKYLDLQTEYPDQCQILRQYNVYKKTMPKQFA